MAMRHRLEYLSATAVMSLASALALAVREYLNTIDVAMIFLLGVVLVASRYRPGPALLASVLSIALFDFFFVPPYYRFTVNDSAYLLTFAMMLVIAVSMSRLTAQIREQARAAAAREQRMATLHAMSRELAGASDRNELAAMAERHLGHAAEGAAVIGLADEQGGLRLPGHRLFESKEVQKAAAWAMAHGEAAGLGTGAFEELDVLLVPLLSPLRPLGVVAVKPAARGRADRSVLEVLAGQTGAALERLVMAERHEEARVAVAGERLRTALLSSLSHDLRTPLGTIEGAASTLADDSAAITPEVRRELLETVLEQSRRMTRLVSNLLDMMRLETGALVVQRTWQPLEESLGVALIRLEQTLRDHPVDVRLAVDLPLVSVDEVLLEQVFVNLLENAAKHSPPGTRVQVSAWPDGEATLVEVSDEGPGIASGEEEAVFRKFYRGELATGRAPSEGSGLGLAICRGIVSAHGGRIWVERGVSRGAAFRFTLPRMAAPPILDLESMETSVAEWP
jgi:two-component system sensor histidine kinase KdpD